MKNALGKFVILILMLALFALTLCACKSSQPQETATLPDNTVSEPTIEATKPATNNVAGSDKTEATTAFQLWYEAESIMPERYMYECIIEGIITADEELERGWLDEGTIRLLRLIKGNIPNDASTQRIIDEYNSLDGIIVRTDYCIRDFFTVDDYGNSTNTGIYNFFEAIDQVEDRAFDGKDVVTISRTGEITGWDFSVAGGNAAVGAALGISEELVLIILHAAVDAGFDVTFD